MPENEKKIYIGGSLRRVLLYKVSNEITNASNLTGSHQTLFYNFGFSQTDEQVSSSY